MPNLAHLGIRRAVESIRSTGSSTYITRRLATGDAAFVFERPSFDLVAAGPGSAAAVALTGPLDIRDVYQYRHASDKGHVPMFRGSDQIEPVVALLEARKASLWHACQLRDLRSYLGVGGIPSRSLLEQSRLDFTPFVTDAADRSAGVWSKVFINLSDFGSAFAHGADSIPNPYGPIVLQIHPRALRRCSDVALCLRSAGARDFDRDAESLSSVDDVERLFHNPIWAPFPESTFTLYGTRLKERFDPRYPEATSPELSISMEPELIPLEDVVVVWVDPIEIDETTLLASTDEAARTAGWSPRLRTRDMGDARRLVLADVVRYLLEAHGPPSLRGLAGWSDVEEVTREWATTVLGRDLDWQFKRYAGYLLEGTLREMVGVVAEPTARAAEAPAAYTADGRPPSYRLPMS